MPKCNKVLFCNYVLFLSSQMNTTSSVLESLEGGVLEGLCVDEQEEKCEAVQNLTKISGKGKKQKYQITPFL